MVRPRAEQPTPAELEVLKIVWDREGPATVREVLEGLNRSESPARAYTTVMSLMNVMAEKGLLIREPQGRAFAYRAAAPREQTLRSLVGETLQKAFSGSASLLVAHLLDQSRPSAEELERIRALIDAYDRDRDQDNPNAKGGDGCRPLRPRRPRA
ncbi:MAG: BlaI/MecI/CopY family transcriptional regulator [Isosphaeraceae bacterium]